MNKISDYCYWASLRQVANAAPEAVLCRRNMYSIFISAGKRPYEIPIERNNIAYIWPSASVIQV